MKIVEVNDKSTRKEFLEFPVRLYKSEKNWIRPLDKDIEGVFDPKKNKKFRKGEACRWLLINDEGETIGKVAAFVNYKDSKKGDFPVGGMGFFDCINDQGAADMLFDTCKHWLEDRGLEGMDGPINFGDRDQWWGCLVDGFTEPNYRMPYNYGYYKDLFEGYGFQIYFKQHTYHRHVKEGGLNDLIYRKSDRVLKNPKYKFMHAKKKDLRKYSNDFATIYNKAWVKHGVPGVSEAQAWAGFKQMKPAIDERILYYGYYEDDPIAFFIMIPEMNQVFKHVNGKLDLIGKLKFLYYKPKVQKIFGVVFGVVPEHQGKGVEAAIVRAFSDMAWDDPKFPYQYIEFNWIGDFNPKMMRVCENVGGKIYKTHHTYRKLFDPNRPFERQKIIQ